MKRVWLVIGLALLLRAPVLGWGFFMDDLGHHLVLEDPSVSPTMTRLNVYDFGYAAQPGEELFEMGAWPWWTSSDWKARFFRPVTSLSLWLDQSVYGRWAVGHHATSLALFAALLALVHALYLRLGFDPKTALLALLLVALEDGSVFVVGWVANRNTLFEAVFGVAALLAALRGRAPPAVLLAALSALSKESGVLFLPFVGAILWSRGRRAGALASFALALLHPLALLAADFGVRTPMYPAPWSPDGPGRFLQQVGLTLTAQPAAMLSPFPVDILVQTAGGRRIAWIAGLILTVPFALLIARGARSAPHARALALFGFLALVPRAMAPMSDRLVFVPFLALAPLAATWLRAGLARRPLPSLPALAVALAALPASGLMLLGRGLGTGPIMRELEQVVLDADVGDEPRDLIVLNYPTPLVGFNPGTVWYFRTGEQRRFFSMQMGRRGLEWSRSDATTFELTSLDEAFFRAFFEELFLSSSAPPEVGERWRAAAFEVEAVRVDAEGLRTIRVRCDEPLESLRFLAWDGARLSPVDPPAVGGKTYVEGVPQLMPWFP